MIFLKKFFNNRVMSGVDPTQKDPSFNATGLLSAAAHDTTAGHLPKSTHT